MLLRRVAVWALVVVASAGVGVLGLLAPWPRFLAVLIGPDPSGLSVPRDPVFTDRNGQPLRHSIGPGGTRGEWIPLARVPRNLCRALLAAEDSRFFGHSGFDLRAIARAFRDNLLAGRIVSGASTITQQTVRLLEPRPRTVTAKITELVRAVALEKTLDKDRILEQYVNRVPMPANRRGVSGGARLLFDRDVEILSLSECALLASLPQAPSRLGGRGLSSGSRCKGSIDRRRRWVLNRMAALGWITRSELDQALAEVPVFRVGRYPFRAPHLVSRLSGRLGTQTGPGVATTLSADVQDQAERIVASHRVRLHAQAASQAACVILDNKSRDVLAWVGSIGWDASGFGYNDGVLARRSAGSTLKPFVYALALERGLLLSEALPDVRRTFATPLGDYDPRNFNRREYGPVSLRTALGSSLNTAAVDLARRVGVPSIGNLLKEFGLLDRPADPKDLGVGIVIGNVEVSLLDLAAAYATLAGGGLYRPPAILRDGPRPPLKKVLTADTSYLVLDVLKDPGARQLTFGAVRAFDFPFPVALKTGTSTGYRDSWAVGVTPRHTVAVWSGNFNGSPTAGLSGASGCGPILHDLLMALQSKDPAQDFARPPGLVEREVCGESGGLPSPYCPARSSELFLLRLPSPGPCSWHRPEDPGTTFLGTAYANWLFDREQRGLGGRHRLDTKIHDTPTIEIVYPHQGDRFITPRSSCEPPEITVRAVPRQAYPFVRWFLNGVEVASTPPPYRWSWKLARGHHTLLATGPDLVGTGTVKFQVE